MTLGFLNEGMAVWGLLAATTILVLVLFFVFVRRRNSHDLPVQRRSRLMSPAEKNFFECLVDSLSADYFIFAKIAMLDVIEASPLATKSTNRLIYKQLHGLCFDFILCKKHDLSIFGVVELENFDSNKSNKDRALREKLISQVCESAHLRLFYFDVRQDYHGVDIERLVTGKSSKVVSVGKGSVSKQHSQFTVDNSSYAAFARERSCPQCNGEVVTKVAVKGKRIGEKFLMCRKYPYCDYRAAMSDKEVIKKMQKKDSIERKHASSEGYTDWSRG